MPKTSPKITIGLYDLAVRLAGKYVCTDVQPFSDAMDLRAGNTSYLPYASYEQDFWLLDGGYKFLPVDTSNVVTGLVSLSTSDTNGILVSIPALTIQFQQSFDIDGLAFHFSEYTGDYCSHMFIRYYDISNNLLLSEHYYPSTTEFYTGSAVSGLGKILVQFIQTNRPYRHLRLSSLDFGELLVFEGETIKELQVVEELDQLSEEIRANSCDITLYSDTGEFSLLNPDGRYTAITRWTPIGVYELVDNQQVFIGQYYLESWSNPSITRVDFRCVDLIGMLDGLTYYGDRYVDVTVGEFIENLLAAAGIPYNLDISLADITLNGWVPVGSYRQALQQLAFAIGASVSCARTGEVTIKPTVLAEDVSEPVLIPTSEQGQGTSIELKPLVTGVEVLGHNFTSTLVTPSEEILNQTLAAGDYTVIFQVPYHDVSVVGPTVTVVASSANHVVINVSATGQVIIKGRPIKRLSRSVEIITGDDSGAEHRLVVEDATLVNTSSSGASSVEVVAQRMFDYHQQRHLCKLKLFAPTVVVGQGVLIDTLFGQQVLGVVEKMVTDLANGMTSKVEVVGVLNDVD